MEKICGIYKITNIQNNKYYIGQSVNIINRWYTHYLKPISDFDKLLRKLGIDNFNFEIIERCPINKLNEREKYWIEYYDSFNNGYNQTKGGDYNREYNIPQWKI